MQLLGVCSDDSARLTLARFERVQPCDCRSVLRMGDEPVNRIGRDHGNLATTERVSDCGLTQGAIYLHRLIYYQIHSCEAKKYTILCDRIKQYTFWRIKDASGARVVVLREDLVV